MNVVELVHDHARTRPDHPAIEDGDQKLSYAALWQRVAHAAAALRRQGVVPGQVVAVMLPDSIGHLVAILALTHSGAVILSLDPDQPESEWLQAIDGLDVRAIVHEQPAKGLQGLRRISAKSLLDYRGAPDEIAEPPAPGATRALLCRQSSGTTGRPKTTIWSHDQVVNWIPRWRHAGGWSEEDRFQTCVRMCFVFSRDQCLAVLLIGATVVITHTQNARTLATDIARDRISILVVTPSHLRTLMSVAPPDAPLFASLRGLFCSTAAISAQEREKARTSLASCFTEVYGTNETGLLALAGPDDQVRKSDAVGRLIDGIDAQVVDEHDRPLPPDTVGLLRLKANTFPGAYHNDPVATARHFRDGWFYPGDVATISADRYLTLKGRADDMINNEGVKVHPSEIEAVLCSHPAVIEAAVVGLPHPLHGQTPVAFIVTQSPEQASDIRSYCYDRLPLHKQPTAFYRVPSLPRNAMGKVLRRNLRPAKRSGRWDEPS